MNLNKVGIYVRKNMDGFLSTLFGMVTKFEQKLSMPHKEVKLTENGCLDRQIDNILLEAEIKKSQAIGLARKFQNC